MEIICRILPICFPNLCPGHSVFNYFPKCCHIFCIAVSEGGFECEAGPAARLISILKADDFSQRCAAAPDQHSCWSLHGQAAGAGFLLFRSWDLIPAHSNLARDIGSAHTPALLVKEEISNSHLQSLLLVSSFQLCLLPVAQATPYSLLHSHQPTGHKIPSFRVILWI